MFLKNRKTSIMLLAFSGSVVIMLVKFLAWWFTGSTAIFSDALESIINVLTTGFALYSVRLASLPRDPNHPYGHGKIEFFSAGIEGSLIACAGLYLCFYAVTHWLQKPQITDLDTGIVLTAITMFANFGLGWLVKKEGKKSDSITLLADGKHLILDAYSTLALLVGLAGMYLTGWYWLDPLLSLAFGILLCINGLKIIRKAIAGLMDEADEATLDKVLEILNDEKQPAWIDVHNLRVQKYGADLHIDAHLTLPYYWILEQVHDEVHAFENRLKSRFRGEVEIFIHTDPCLPECCKYCQVGNCEVRGDAFSAIVPWKRENITTNRKHFEGI